MPSPIAVIVLSSVSASTETTLGILLGVVLAHPRLNLLYNVQGVAILSKVMVYAFFPLFTFQLFGNGLDLMMLKEVWIIPVWACCMHILWYILGELFFPFPKKCGVVQGFHRYILILCVTFINNGFFPMVYLTSLVATSHVTDDPKREDKMLAFINLYCIPQIFIMYSVLLYFLERYARQKRELEQKRKGVQPADTYVIQATVDAPKKERKMKIWSIVKKLFGIVSTFLSPAILGMIFGTIVAVIPSVKNFIFTNPPYVIVSFRNVIDKFSSTVLGISLVITGANIGRTIFKEREKPEGYKRYTWYQKFVYTFKLKHVSYISVIKNVLLRQLLTPCIVFIIFLAFMQVGPYIIPEANDRILIYLLFLVEAGVPTGLSLNMFVNLVNEGVEYLGEITLIHYICAPFTMVITTISALYIVCSFEQCAL